MERKSRHVSGNNVVERRKQNNTFTNQLVAYFTRGEAKFSQKHDVGLYLQQN